MRHLNGQLRAATKDQNASWTSNFYTDSTLLPIFCGPSQTLRNTSQPSRVIVMFRSTAIRSERGGWVLNIPERTCPAVKGATINREAVAGETSIGIRAL